jgi:hypothetical protein
LDKYTVTCGFERNRDLTTVTVTQCHNQRVHSRHAHSAIAALVLFSCVTGTISAQSNADREWIEDHFSHALNKMLPLELPGIYVAYRSHRDLYTDTLEYSFVIARDVSAKGRDGQFKLVAQVRQADSSSIYDQMMALHRKSPSRSAASIQKELRVKAWTLVETTCPAVRTQLLKFQQLRLVPPQFDDIVLHPLIHEFRVRAGMGDMDIALYDEDNLFVQWALETRRALELCATNHE